jgi:cbb3-type cytochrome oxidase subunit 3
MLAIIWFLIVLICSIWAAIDASNREKSACLVFLLVFFLGPIGLIIWLLIRP